MAWALGLWACRPARYLWLAALALLVFYKLPLTIYAMTF